MNTTSPILTIPDENEIREENAVNEQFHNSKDAEDLIHSTKNEKCCLPNKKGICNPEDNIYTGKAIQNSQLDKKCLDNRSPPSGIEKNAISPEWQYVGAGDGLAIVGSDEDAESKDIIWRIPKSLNELLNDASAIVPFQTFIQADYKAYDMLLFWFACNGLQKMHKEDSVKFNESAEVIWIKFIRNHKVKVSDSIFDYIKANIRKYNLSPLLGVFTAAQKEIERKMQNIFLKFCESEIYLSWLIKQEDAYFHSSPDELSFIPSLLPTLPEDSELIPQPDDKAPRLSSMNLLRSVNYREKEQNSIPERYERFSSNCSKHENPYHMGYTVGPTVSTLDSEINSISSGAQTNETFSFTDSSVDGSFKARMNSQSRREHHRIKQSAKINPEPIGNSLTLGLIGPVPRQHIPHKIEEFASEIIQKLEVVQQKRDSNEKLEHSLFKMAQNENTSDHLRRLHAENSLPPNILADKLAEKVQADSEPSQSILDDHVARVWDSPKSPGSPHLAKTRQFPHMNYFCGPKVPHGSDSTPKLTNVGRHSKYSARGAESRMYYGKAPLMSRQHMHNIGARLMVKLQGLDVNSTISSDSGNVADYRDACDRRIAKPRSMPEDMENNASNSLATGRRVACDSRRVNRRPPNEPDSGVSVVSDSKLASVCPYVPSDRINSWLNQSKHYTSDGTAHSVYQCNTSDCSVTKGTRSVHTVGGSISPGAQRSCSSRRSQCSSSLSSGKTCHSTRPQMSGKSCSLAMWRTHPQKRSPNNTVSCSDDLRTMSAVPQNVPNYHTDRRNRLSSSSSQFCVSQSGMCNSFDEQVAKTTLAKKPAKTADGYLINDMTQPETQCATNATYPSKHSTHMTPIVYNFQDDKWPYKTKVPTSCVTLREFKEHLPKKGNFRYFFKKFCDDIGSVVFEEITSDTEAVPLFEGKIVSQIRKDE